MNLKEDNGSHWKEDSGYYVNVYSYKIFKK